MKRCELRIAPTGGNDSLTHLEASLLRLREVVGASRRHGSLVFISLIVSLSIVILDFALLRGILVRRSSDESCTESAGHDDLGRGSTSLKIFFRSFLDDRSNRFTGRLLFLLFIVFFFRSVILRE
jgi:hypothetical protein